MLLDEADFVHRASNIVQGDLSAIVESSKVKKLNTSRKLHMYIHISIGTSFKSEKKGRQFYMIEKYAKFEIQSVTPLEGKRIKCEDLILSWTPGLS